MAEITIKPDIELVTFDDLLEMVDLFGNISLENLDTQGVVSEVIQKYRPLLSYFVVDKDGKRIDPEEAQSLIGKIPAKDVLPHIQPMIQVITELSGMMALPPEKGSN